MTGSGAGNHSPSSPRRPRSRQSDAQDRRASQHFPQNNLPNPLTSFVGRQVEVEAVASLIRDESVRLLTLTGPGGIGKTRLAFKVVEALLPYFEDGAYFVALASLSDPQLVMPTIAQTLDIKEDGTTPLIERLGDHLRDKGLLLLLDNFEQVARAAPQVTALLQGAPGVQVIITSRVSMRIYGEHEYPVPPMLLPDTEDVQHTVEQLAEYEAIQLFIERAQLIHPDFTFTPDNAQAIAQICARLDGLPLALELAAARTRLLSPQALLSRLDKSLSLLTGGPRDLPDRQKTLRGAMDWSYDLLDATEQKLFARLSVFVGGCTLDAAARITQDLGITESDLVDKLESLVDKNMLRLREEPDGEPRFWMLATIREYALEKLAENGDIEAVKQVHAHYFFQLAVRAEPELRGANQAFWLDLLAREHDNLRVALGWGAQDKTQADMAARLVSALWRFWIARGYITEGRQWFETTPALIDIAGTGTEQAQPWHLDLFNNAGALAGMQGDYARAEELTHKSLQIARRLDQQQSVARSLNNLGIIARRQGNYALAQDHLAACLQVYRELGARPMIASTLTNLAVVAHIRGDYDLARGLISDSIALRRELGDKTGLAISLNNLAGMAREHKDFRQARSLVEEGMAVSQEIDHKQAFSHARTALAAMLCDQGDYIQAKPLLEECLQWCKATGDASQVNLILGYLGRVELHEENYVLARSLFREALDEHLRTREFNTEAVDTLEWTASLDIAQAERQGAAYKTESYRRAALVLGAAWARREEMVAPLPPVSQAHHAATIRTVRAYLGDDEFGVAWSRGRDLGFKGAATLAANTTSLPSALVSPSAPTAFAEAETLMRNPTQSAQADPSVKFSLTERELDVLRLVAEGLTNKEIAERLVLSHRTVQNHLYNIFNKLGVTTRSAATRYALEQGTV